MFNQIHRQSAFKSLKLLNDKDLRPLLFCLSNFKNMNYSIEHIDALIIAWKCYYDSSTTIQPARQAYFRVDHFAKCMVPLQQNIVQWTQQRRMNHPNHTQWGQPRPFRSSPSAEVIPHHWSPPSYWQSASIERPPPTLLGWTLRHHNQHIEEELLFFYVCKLANFFLALLHFEAYYCYLVKLCPEQTGVSRGSVNNGSMCR